MSKPSDTGRTHRPSHTPTILHVITGLDTGGSEMMLYKLIAAHGGAGFHHHVLSLTPPGNVGDRMRGLDVDVRTLKIRSRVPKPWSLVALLRVVRAVRPDLIHGWMPHGNVAALIGRMGLPGRTPLIWSIRNALYTLAYEPRTTRLMIRAAARLSFRPDRIVFNSSLAAEQHVAFGYDATRVTVIPNGFECPDAPRSSDVARGVRDELEIPSDATVIGMVARYHPMKDHPTLLRAAARVLESVPNVYFVLVGRGIDAENAALTRQIADLRLTGHVRLLGERTDTARLYASMDAATLTSYTEAFPNAIGEAMAAGVPCVATDVGDVKWIIGDTGYVVPARDPAALARAMVSMIRLSPEERHRMGEGARSRVRNEFSLDLVARRYGDLYWAVLEGGGA